MTLDRADVAFGPAYFCAAASGSSTLCGSALAEMRRVARFDALASDSVDLGRVSGFTGQVRSVSYDLGLSWFDTQSTITPAPETPGGHSLVLAGNATRGATVVPFVAVVDAVPQYQGQHAIATAPAEGIVDSNACVLQLHVDAVAWLTPVDFDAVAAHPERPAIVGPGSQEHNAILVGLKNLAPIAFRWVPLNEIPKENPR